MTQPTLGSVRIAGVEYPFVPMDSLGVREQFEDWMILEGERQLNRWLRQMVTPEGKPDVPRQRDQQDSFRRDVTACKFMWGEEQWVNVFPTVYGQRKCFEIMFNLAKAGSGKALVEQVFSLDREERRRITEELSSFGLDPKPSGSPATAATEKAPTAAAEPVASLPS